MIKQGHLGNIELFILFALYQVILTTYNLPTVLANRAATGAWLLNILLNAGGLLLFIPLYLLLKRFPDQSIIEIASEVLGPAGRIIVTILSGGLYFYYLVIFVRVWTEMIKAVMLPSAPVSVIMAIALLAPVLIGYLGLEQLGRTALIFAPFILLGVVLFVSLSLPGQGLEGLFPILGVSPLEHLTNALQLSPLVHETLFLGIWAPYFRKGNNLLKFVIWGFILTSLLTTAQVIVLQLVFPYPLLQLIPTPIDQAVRTIYLGRFIQRLEAVYVVMFIVVSALNTATALLNGTLAVAQGLRLQDWRPVIFPWVVIAFAAAMVPRSAVDLSIWFYLLPNSIIYAIISVGVPVLLYGAALLRRKKGGSRLEPQTD